MKTQNRQGKRRLNYKNCYVLVISLVAGLSLMGNFFQDMFYNKAIAIQQQTIETMSVDDAGQEISYEDSGIHISRSDHE